jgi:hypothetical protein
LFIESRLYSQKINLTKLKRLLQANQLKYLEWGRKPGDIKYGLAFTFGVDFSDFFFYIIWLFK